MDYKFFSVTAPILWNSFAEDIREFKLPQRVRNRVRVLLVLVFVLVLENF